jgi:hypothetical protein
MPPNLEARLERAVTQIEALDDRIDALSLQQRAGLDEVKLIIDKGSRDVVEAERLKAAKLDAFNEKMDARVQSVEFWRWMLFGAFSTLTVFGTMAWYLTSNLMLDEIRNIRTHMNIPAPAAAK